MAAAKMQVAERIRECAAAAGLRGRGPKDRGLAGKISDALGEGLTRSAVDNWLKGLAAPKAENAYKLEFAAGKPVGYIRQPIDEAMLSIMAGSSAPMRVLHEGGATSSQPAEVPIDVALSAIDVAAFTGKLTPAHRVRLKSILMRASPARRQHGQPYE